jgi:hypothetical protein
MGTSVVWWPGYDSCQNSIKDVGAQSGIVSDVTRIVHSNIQMLLDLLFGVLIYRWGI